MTALALLTLVLAAPIFPEVDSFVVNPGFEETTGELPVRWNVFVMPQPGAVGRLDRTSLSGEFSAMLHTPLPYEKEPTNNWSQNVIAEVAGRKLRLRGHIKTLDATEAAVWVQCWRKRPLRLLRLVNTSTDAPMYGTREWEEVSAEFTVPASTDFLTIRCVLLGTGTAWFDDIQLEAAEKDTASALDTVGADAEESAESPFRIRVVGPDGVEYPEITLGTPPDELTEGDLAARLADLGAEIKRLSEANQAMTEALDAIRADNADLMAEVLTLRLELQEKSGRGPGTDRGSRAIDALDPPKLPAAIAPTEGRKD